MNEVYSRTPMRQSLMMCVEGHFGSALVNMFAWVILAYLPNLEALLGFWGYF